MLLLMFRRAMCQGLQRAALLLVASALFSAVPAQLLAATSNAPPANPVAPTPGNPAHELSREQAVELVQKRYGARVVRTQFIDQDGRHLYVLRMLSPAGKVWIVRLDAHTGTEVR
jgi:hypothetical protein